MSHVLLISYDLNGRERPSAYEAVRKVIEANAISAVKPLYSQWFVETSRTPDEWQSMLKGVIDKDDYLFICHVRRPYQGWLSKSVWEWLNARVLARAA